MKYISTRGDTPEQSFCQAVRMGLADDGGLLLPKSIPDISKKLDDWRKLNYTELAFEVISLFVDDIDKDNLKKIVTDSTSNFTHPEVTPCVDIGKLTILELFHGPTLAFKDVALQFLGNVFEHILQRDGGELNILGATSGDTGSAAIQGVRGKDNINIFIMHPDGKTSPLQALQMTSVLDSNVHNLAVDGTFDDCQHIMKSAFGDLDFKEKYSLGAVNSVNWARILAQIVYYVHASLQNTDPNYPKVNFSVPTGNFGDIFAGFLAKRMGAPIEKLILATNENDILAQFFETGIYKKGSVQHTISPSMDIQVASNFERYLYYHFDENPTALKEAMASFEENKELVCEIGESGIDARILFGSANTEQTLTTIKKVWRKHQYLLDPHTATSVFVAEKNPNAYRTICLATAHPAKFPSAIHDALGEDLATHPTLEALKNKDTRCDKIDADVESVKNYLKLKVTS